MQLACRVQGYDSERNNKRFSNVLVKKLFQTLTLDENVKMLLLGTRLNLRTPSLERLEMYVVDEFEANADELRKNEALLVAYIGTYLPRKKCSRLMVQQGRG